MRLIPLGDSAVTVQTASAGHARALAGVLGQQQWRGVVDVVAAFECVTVYYDAPSLTVSCAQLCEAIFSLARHTEAADDEATHLGVIEIPVRYGGEAGPDLQAVAESKGLTPVELIDLHTAAEYVVLAVGFLPGFAYLGGLPEILHAPRRSTPRTLVPAGSVGIGGGYTGVYPFASPGGWNLIGQTSIELFNPHHTPPAKMQVGMRVRFIRDHRS